MTRPVPQIYFLDLCFGHKVADPGPTLEKNYNQDPAKISGSNRMCIRNILCIKMCVFSWQTLFLLYFSNGNGQWKLKILCLPGRQALFYSFHLIKIIVLLNSMKFISSQGRNFLKTRKKGPMAIKLEGEAISRGTFFCGFP